MSALDELRQAIYGDIALLCEKLGLTNEQQALRIKDDVLPGVPVNRQAREALAKAFERDLGYER